MNPDDFVLEHVKTYELIHFTREQNAESWKKMLSKNDYAVREYVLGKSPMLNTHRNKLYVFMLRDLKHQQSRLCSMELCVREAWKFKWDDDLKMVTQEKVLSGCIGGVFTYPKYRNKGYARIMIDKAVALAKESAIGPNGFTFLYSEIGDYYSKSGFTSFPVPLIKFPLSRTSISPSISGSFKEVAQSENLSIQLINYHEFKPYMDLYRKQRESLLRQEVVKDHKTRVMVDPVSEIIDWFHLRAKYYSMSLFYPDLKVDYFQESYETIVDVFKKIDPMAFGISLRDKNDKVVGFIIWSYDWTDVDSRFEYSSNVLKIYVDSDADYDYHAMKLISLMKLFLETEAKKEAPLKYPKSITIWSSEISEAVEKDIMSHNWNAVNNMENPSRSAVLMNTVSEDKELKEGNLIWDENTKVPWF